MTRAEYLELIQKEMADIQHVRTEEICDNTEFPTSRDFLMELSLRLYDHGVNPGLIAQMRNPGKLAAALEQNAERAAKT